MSLFGGSYLCVTPLLKSLAPSVEVLRVCSADCKQMVGVPHALIAIEGQDDLHAATSRLEIWRFSWSFVAELRYTIAHFDE